MAWPPGVRCGEPLEGDAATAVAHEQRFFLARLRCGFWQPCGALRGSCRQDASQASNCCVEGPLRALRGPRVAPRERSSPQTNLRTGRPRTILRPILKSRATLRLPGQWKPPRGPNIIRGLALKDTSKASKQVKAPSLQAPLWPHRCTPTPVLRLIVTGESVRSTAEATGYVREPQEALCKALQRETPRARRREAKP